ncbi:MAG: polyprenyl synthetase family protein [Flavobacteriales bacterium]|nr:polyprenyl synthetase family protein [Flavobacteriales bacterium]MDW8409337.1 polyprenyl synthetase family protein [Flavobacteriales bacterium]
MHQISREKIFAFLEAYQQFHDSINFRAEPANLYEPIRYIMGLGGKRLRPLLVLAACDAVGGSWRQALSQAYAIELFHNFTLVHDDIMDKASLRRGQPTVHLKFGENSAILAGDAMAFYCQMFLAEGLPAPTQAYVLSLFNTTAIRIIEGQQMDMDFEDRLAVDSEDYLKMIEYKTSVLLACALQIGAVIGGAPPEMEKAFYNAGLGIGLAFQIRDDILDAFGDERFGKIKGGDILNNKKTLLYILARENASPDDQHLLEKLITEPDAEKKIHQTLAVFERSGARVLAEEKAKAFHEMALRSLNSLSLPVEGKNLLLDIAQMIYERQF